MFVLVVVVVVVVEVEVVVVAAAAAAAAAAAVVVAAAAAAAVAPVAAGLGPRDLRDPGDGGDSREDRGEILKSNSVTKITTSITLYDYNA